MTIRRAGHLYRGASGLRPDPLGDLAVARRRARRDRAQPPRPAVERQAVAVQRPIEARSRRRDEILDLRHDRVEGLIGFDDAPAGRAPSRSRRRITGSSPRERRRCPSRGRPRPGWRLEPALTDPGSGSGGRLYRNRPYSDLRVHCASHCGARSKAAASRPLLHRYGNRRRADTQALALKSKVDCVPCRCDRSSPEGEQS